MPPTNSNSTPTPDGGGFDAVAHLDFEREIIVSRVFPAPRELVWEAWTNPAHVAQWWGPRGFSTTIQQMDVRPGGLWEHTMHGPDGTNYPNKSVFQEVVKPERIVYSHSGCRENARGVSFTATWTFEALAPELTRLTIRQVFASRAERDRVAREYGAVEGGRQTLTRLSEHLAGKLSAPFVIEREFDAPRELVWRAWTEQDQLGRWFGPKGFTTIHAELDLRPGGRYLYAIRAPDGKELWGRFIYREIKPPEKLVWVNSFSDPTGGLTRHPLTTDAWPLHLLTEVTFTEHDGRTRITLKWTPLDATAEERAVFERGRPSMNGGWGGTFERFASYVAETRGGVATPA